VPVALKVFLAALAIVDDIGAVLVIAVFYTEGISVAALGTGFALLLLSAVANRLEVRRPFVYLLIGVGAWLAFLQSGVHATVAGVLMAMTIPARTRIDTATFLRRGRRLMDAFDAAGEEGPDIMANRGQQEVVHEIELLCEKAQAPLQRMEHELHRLVAFFIVPLFALANAGVALGGGLADAFAAPVTLGVILGLVIGKPVGITLFAWLAVKLGAAARPRGVSWGAIHGVSWLGGIGFTMSLFVTGLAFTDAAAIDQAKVGIFAASLAAGVMGWVMLRRARPRADDPVADEEGDEEEEDEG
jgi:NhaA family Na+:H+ antiporter